MKSIITLILLVCGISSAMCQDLIISKDGNIYKVKIVKAEKDALYMYMEGDTAKSIRKISLNIISSYEYNSRNDLSTKAEDSVLYANYTKQKEFNMLESGTSSTPTMYDLKVNSPAEYYFTKAKNQFVTSTVSSIIGIVVINILAQNLKVPTDFSDPKYLEQLNDYVSTLKTLQNIQYACIGASAVFTIAAGNNFFNGFVELSKMKSKN